MSETKFRPYVSASKMKHLIDLCKKDASPLSIKILEDFELYDLKITHGIVKASYKTVPTIAEKLELDDPKPKIDSITPEIAFNKWKDNPTLCSPEEINLAMQWRLINNMMTPWEEYDYTISTMPESVHEMVTKPDFPRPE